MLLLSRAGIRDRANGFQSYWDYRTKGLPAIHIARHTKRHLIFFFFREGVGTDLTPLCRLGAKGGVVIEERYTSMCSAERSGRDRC